MFIYGLVFFIMGFAIILQISQASRLELARTLRWIAAFRLMYGSYKMGQFFILTQVQYLGPPAIALLRSIQLCLLAVSLPVRSSLG